MSPEAILKVLETAAPDVSWQVDGDGYHNQVEGVGVVFDGLNAVKRQQYVYSLLNEYIANGSLHAVSIATFTPAEKSDS